MAKEKAKAAAKSAGKRSKAAAKPVKKAKVVKKAAPVKAKAPARPAPAKAVTAKPRKVATTPPAPAPATPAAAKVVAKEAAPKLKIGRGKGRAALAPAPLAQPLDLETRRTRLKNLIALGKERGFLTYAEVNDHLPDEMLDDDDFSEDGNQTSKLNVMGQVVGKITPRI